MALYTDVLTCFGRCDQDGNLTLAAGSSQLSSDYAEPPRPVSSPPAEVGGAFFKSVETERR